MLRYEMIDTYLKHYLIKIGDGSKSTPLKILTADSINTINNMMLAKYAGIDPLSDGWLTRLNRLNEETLKFAKKIASKTRVSTPTSNMLALILTNARTFINLSFMESKDKSLTLLAFYNEDEGIYNTNEIDIKELIYNSYPEASTKLVNEVIEKIRVMVPIKEINKDPDLIPLNNGIYNYREDKLMEFTPNIILQSKSSVNFNEDIEEPEIAGWKPSVWLKELSNNQGFDTLIYQILGALLRPYVSWNQAALFFNTHGRNGKGTVAELAREIIGQENVASIPIARFGDKFALSELINKTAIVVDENSVSGYLEDASDFKAAVTGDSISIDRKYRNPVSYKFKGFMIQCINDLPKVRDKSNSFLRRIIIVPFDKTFTKNQEIKEIKDDYIKRPEVKERFVKHILKDMPKYYSIIEPDFCKEVLDKFEEGNDNVVAFMKDFIRLNTYKIITPKDLYEIYKAWIASNVGNVNRNVVRKSKFIEKINDYFSKNGEYIFKKDYRFNLEEGGYKEDNPILLECEFKNQRYFDNLYFTAINNLSIFKNNIEDYKDAGKFKIIDWERENKTSVYIKND